MPRYKGKYIKNHFADMASEFIQDNAQFIDVVGYTVAYNGKRYVHKTCTYQLTLMVAEQMQKRGFA